MKKRNPEAARLEGDYLLRVQSALVGHANAGSILENAREHIEEGGSEFSADEISLVQMARILEQLGPPEAFVPEGKAPEPQGVPNNMKAQALQWEKFKDEIRFFDRLWIAAFIGAVGLYVPIVNLHVCDLIYFAMIAVIFSGRKYPESYRNCSPLGWWCFGLSLALFPLGLFSLAVPGVAILSLPMGIALGVLNLFLYWRVMTGMAELVEEVGEVKLCEWTCRRRNAGIAAGIVFSVLAFLIGIVIGLSVGNNKKDHLWAELIMPLFVIPSGWILGWYFLLRPISRAKEVFRELKLVNQKQENSFSGSV